MLQDLDKVPWSSLQHAYGPATDTPRHLRDLASSDRWAQEEAYDKLATSIYHQGSIYPAAVATVPFLVEILKTSSAQGKHWILRLLRLLATGGSWHDSHQHLELYEQKRETPEWQAKIREEQGWVTELRAELEKHIAIYVMQLDDEEKLTRLYASHLLAGLPDLSAQSVPALVDRLRSELDAQVRANILRVLGALDLQNQRAVFERACQEEKDRLPRCVALAGFTAAAKGDTPKRVLDQLTRCILSADDELMERYYELPSIGDFPSDMAMPLALASPEHAERMLPWYAAWVEGQEVVMPACAFNALAVALMPGGQKADVNNLSEGQRWVVWAIARKVWPESNWGFLQQMGGNLVDILRQYGLPDNPDAMSELLGMPLYEAGPADSGKKPWWRFW